MGELEKRIFVDAVEKFGAEKQIIVAIEELSELIKALTKWLRFGGDMSDGGYLAILEQVEEERADVAIMLGQLEVIFGENQEAECWKLLRLAGMVGDYRLRAETGATSPPLRRHLP